MLNKLKRLVKEFLIKVSRCIYWLIPKEFKKPNKESLSYMHEKEMRQECYKHFKCYYEKSMLFRNEVEIRKFAIEQALLNDKEKKLYYLEFGVFMGISTNFFSKYTKKLYAFDSFEGLSEDWTGTYKAKNTFNTNKKVPKLNNNVELVIGYIQKTLKGSVKEHKLKINFTCEVSKWTFGTHEIIYAG